MKKSSFSILFKIYLIFFSFLNYKATSMNSTMERTQYPRTQYNINTNSRNVNSQIDAPNISQQNLHQMQQQQSGNMPMTQTPENAYGYDSMPSNYRYNLKTYYKIRCGLIAVWL